MPMRDGDCTGGNIWVGWHGRPTMQDDGGYGRFEWRMCCDGSDDKNETRRLVICKVWSDWSVFQCPTIPHSGIRKTCPLCLLPGLGARGVLWHYRNAFQHYIVKGCNANFDAFWNRTCCAGLYNAAR